jgi:hypothetical protein
MNPNQQTVVINIHRCLEFNVLIYLDQDLSQLFWAEQKFVTVGHPIFIFPCTTPGHLLLSKLINPKKLTWPFAGAARLSDHTQNYF